MPITYIGRSTALANAATGITPTAPPEGLEVDDIVLFPIETANQAITIANQNGGTWTEAPSSPQGLGTGGAAAAVRITCFWTRWNGTQGAPTTSDSGDHQTGLLLSFRGVKKTGDPFNTSAGNTQGATTSASIPGGTTTVDGCMICAISACDRDANSTTNASAWANASLASITERVDQTFQAATGGGLAIATGIDDVAGTVNATTWTQAASANLAHLMLALEPEPEAVLFPHKKRRIFVVRSWPR